MAFGVSYPLKNLLITSDVDENGNKTFSNAHIEDNLNRIYLAINGGGDSVLGQLFRLTWVFTGVGNQYNFFEDIRFRSVKDSIEGINQFLFDDILKAKQELLTLMFQHSPQSFWEEHGFLYTLLFTQKILWDDIRQTNALSEFYNKPFMESIVIELIKDGKPRLSGMDTRLTDLEDNMFKSTLFTQSGDINRLNGIERELTFEGKKRLTKIEDVMENILSEIGGEYQETGLIIDSRIDKLESGNGGRWDEVRVSLIESKILTIDTKLNNLISGDIKDLKTLTTSLQEQLDAFKLTIQQDIKTRLTSLEFSRTLLNSVTIPNIESDISKALNNINGFIIPQLTSLHARVTKNEVDIAGIEGFDIITILKAFDALETKFKTLDQLIRGDLLNDVILLKSAQILYDEITLPNIKIRLTQLETDLAKFVEPDLTDIKADIAALQLWKNELVIPDTTLLQTRITELETWKNALVIPDTTELQAQLLLLDKAIKEMDITKIAGLQQELSRIEALITGISIPDISKIESDLQALVEWKAALVIPDIKPLIDRLDAIEADFNQGLLDKIESIGNDIATLTGQFNDFGNLILPLLVEKIDKQGNDMGNVKTFINAIFHEPALLFPPLVGILDGSIGNNKPFFNNILLELVK